MDFLHNDVMKENLSLSPLYETCARKSINPCGEFILMWHTPQNH